MTKPAPQEFPPRLWANATWRFANEKPIWTADQIFGSSLVEFLSCREHEAIRQADRAEIERLTQEYRKLDMDFSEFHIIAGFGERELKAENAKLRAALDEAKRRLKDNGECFDCGEELEFCDCEALQGTGEGD